MRPLGLVATAIAAFALQSQDVFLQTLDGTLVIKTVKYGSGLKGNASDYVFDLTGDPVFSIELSEQGATLAGRKGTGEISLETPQESGALRKTGAPAYAVRTANIEGDALFIVDSAMRDKAMATRAGRLKLPPPELQDSTDHTELHTERFAYTGTALAGTLTLPASFTVLGLNTGKTHPKIKGVVVTKDYRQTSEMAGVNGTITLDLLPNKASMLHSGVIQGPATFKIVRTETSEAVPVPEVTTLNGKADRIEFGLTEDGSTITATGHVEMEGDNPTLSGTTHANKIVIVFDKDHQAKEIDVEFGRDEYRIKPAAPTVKPAVKKGGGGRR